MAVFHSIWTVVLFIVFIGIVIWAWSARRKKDFDEAARLPLDEDPAPGADKNKSEHTHG